MIEYCVVGIFGDPETSRGQEGAGIVIVNRVNPSLHLKSIGFVSDTFSESKLYSLGLANSIYSGEHNPKTLLVHQNTLLLSLWAMSRGLILMHSCVKKFSENFTILLFHYDGRTSESEEFEWSKWAIHISVAKKTKWWYAKRCLHPDIVAPYGYIFIWDEDLGVEHFNAEECEKDVEESEQCFKTAWLSQKSHIMKPMGTPTIHLTRVQGVQTAVDSNALCRYLIVVDLLSSATCEYNLY